jgi:hypothetical protein
VKLKVTIRKQTNKKKNPNEIKKNKNKQKQKKETTQKQNLTAAARDLGTVPSGQIMFDAPQLCRKSTL